jgi:putative NADH-flavin reductase
MRIAVLAANGRSGQRFVHAALQAGHTVQAGTHRQNPFPEHPRLTTYSCDATRPTEVTQLIEGADAVVSLIGHVRGSAPFVQTDAMRVLIQCMGEQNIKRVITLTGTGVRFPGDRVPLYDRFLNLAVRLIDPARVRDGLEHVQLLQKSGLDWTVLRVLKLEQISSRPFRLTPHGPTKLVVSRDDVARAILEVLEHDSFVREAPILSAP